MAVSCALITPLYMAIQSVLCGDIAAPAGGNFNDFIQALQVLGFTPRASVQPHCVFLDPPNGWNQAAGPLRLPRPVGNIWYSYENADVARALDDQYGLTASSFIKCPDIGLLPSGVNGYVIPAREGK